MRTLLMLKPNGQDVYKFKMEYISNHLYFIKSGLKAIGCSHVVDDCLKSLFNHLNSANQSILSDCEKFCLDNAFHTRRSPTKLCAWFYSIAGAGS